VESHHVHNQIKAKVVILSVWWAEDDDQYTSMKDMIEDTQDHSIEVSTFTFGKII